MVTNLENWSRFEFQTVIRCLWERRVSAADIHLQSMKVYCNGVIPRQHFVMRCHTFASGRVNVTDDKRSGPRSSSQPEVNTAGPHSHGETRDFVANGIWPCFIQQQYAAYRSGCVRLLSHRKLLALRLQCNDTIHTTLYVSNTGGDQLSTTCAAHCFSMNIVINCNSDDIWVNITVSLH